MSADGATSPKPLTFTLLRMLADGEFHSGEMLAQRLGISRASVHQAMRNVPQLGLDLYSVRGRGYRLAVPLQWLDAARINKLMGKTAQQFHIEVSDSGESSNTLLLQRAEQDVAQGGASSGTVLMLEWQSAGRGRMGRTWHSALGSALTFSVLWRFERGVSALSGLSLAIGVGLVRAVHKLGAQNVCLKWPNDVLDAEGAKLAGILVEARGDMLGPCTVVMGIGLNLTLSKNLRRQLAQPVTSLDDLLPDLPERNYLVAVLLCELHGVLCEFAAHGFAALRTEWERYHGWQDLPVQLLQPDGAKIKGVARGVDVTGALRVETAQGIKNFNAGEISLRKGV